MKVWRKNRTQYAQLFNISGNYILGFLVGDCGSIQTIETLKGEIKTISKNIRYNATPDLTSLKESQEVETVIEKGENCNYEIKTYNDGRKESRPISRI